MRQVQLPTFSAQRIKSLKKQLVDQKLSSELWGRTSGHIGAFKSELTNELLKNQGKRCAYCGSYLFEKNPHRDHIAPKVPYFKWTFWPANLVLACYPCNTDRKKTFDPITNLHLSYRRTKFRIIHPYFDDPKDHLTFIGHRGSILVKPKAGSTKGRETIQLFDLMSPERAKQRAKDAIFDADVGHLHGRFKYLFEQFALSPLPQTRALKMKR